MTEASPYKWVSSNQSQQPEIRAPSNLLASPSATTPAAGVSVVHNNNGRDSLDLAFPSAPSPLQEHSCREARGGFSQLICGSPVRERRAQDPGWRAKRTQGIHSGSWASTRRDRKGVSFSGLASHKEAPPSLPYNTLVTLPGRCLWTSSLYGM